MEPRAARGGPGSESLPLFPLHTVLFPGGVLPLRIFEQRYIAMIKACLAEQRPFGVCLITAGDEVMGRSEKQRAAPEFAGIGTTAEIVEWDMPQLGILHVRTEGRQRFKVERHAMSADGLIAGTVTELAAEPTRPVADTFAPLVRLLELIATRMGAQNFPQNPRYDDASWVGYRLAEVLPLPLAIKQSMLEINDSEVRLAVLMRFVAEQGLL